jgi:hypothetical protein
MSNDSIEDMKRRAEDALKRLGMGYSFQDRFQRALEDKIPNPTCPLCGTKEWSVGDAVIWFNARYRTPEVNNWVNALPCGSISCNNCGNTHFINLAAYGDKFKGDW